MALGGWRVLRAGNDQDVLLAVDFTLTRARAQATFTSLAAGLPSRYSVWGTEDSGWPARPGDPREHLRDWSSRSAGEDAFPGTVHAVLGYCAGAPLAGALALRLAGARGIRPALVLFDPLLSTARALLDHFESSLVAMEGQAGAGELEAARAGASSDAEAAGGAGPAGLAELATRLSRRYEGITRPVCAAQKVPSAIADQLCRRHEINLRYLAMSAAAGVPDVPGTLVVHSAGHELPEPYRGRNAIATDCPHDDLLAAPVSIDAVTTALAAAAGDTTVPEVRS